MGKCMDFFISFDLMDEINSRNLHMNTAGENRKTCGEHQL